VTQAIVVRDRVVRDTGECLKSLPLGEQALRMRSEPLERF